MTLIWTLARSGEFEIPDRETFEAPRRLPLREAINPADGRRLVTLPDDLEDDR